MERKDGTYVTEWKIENLSHWCAEVHGDCIQSSKFNYPCSHMELYPKGIGGQGEHLVVRLCEVRHSSPVELSFHSSDGSVFCSEQQVSSVRRKDVLELPPGPEFEDVLSRIREGEDFLILRLRETADGFYYMERICTTINVLTISLKINLGWIEMMESDAREDICDIRFPLDDCSDRMELYTCSENNILHFMIEPPTSFQYPFAVEMCMSWTGSDANAVNCLKNEHVFRTNNRWTLPYPLEKKELAGKEISLFVCLTTKNMIQRPSYGNWVYSNVSIELNNTSWLCTIAPSSTAPVTHDKVTMLTNDSGSQPSLTSDSPDDSLLLLSKELMCLYQDQKFSDLVLKCDNVTFPVHKNILSARSPVLERLLSSDMKEAASSEVDIRDLDPSTLSRFLTYLYTGAVEDLQCDRALELYYAADKYQVPSLKKECSDILCSNVSFSNVCDILSLGDRHQDDELTAASHVFILDHYNDVLKSNEWESFMCREPLLAVKTLTHFGAKDSVKHDPK